MSREDELSVGGKMRIKAGPFQGFIVTMTEIDKHQELVCVKIDIFGRPEAVEFNFSDIATEE